jgi:hypothetical protein
MKIKKVYYGKYCDLYVARHSFRLGFVQNNKKKSDHRKQEYKHRNSVRAYNTIVKLINCNFDNSDTFLTLTVDPKRNDPFNREFVLRSVKLFTRRVRKDFPDFKYLYVLETHKSGAYHVHMVCTLPQVPRILKINDLLDYWKLGLVRSVSLYNGLNAGKYLAKYINKQPKDKERSYFCSKNLQRPVIKYYLGNDYSFLLDITNITHKYSYYSDVCGKIKLYEAKVL